MAPTINCATENTVHPMPNACESSISAALFSARLAILPPPNHAMVSVGHELPIMTVLSMRSAEVDEPKQFLDAFIQWFLVATIVVNPSYNNTIYKHNSNMTGRENGGDDLAKGGAKRHRKVLRDNIQGITKLAIRRVDIDGPIDAAIDRSVWKSLGEAYDTIFELFPPRPGRDYAGIGTERVYVKPARCLASHWVAFGTGVTYQPVVHWTVQLAPEFLQPQK
ncbi:hypothetical protein O3G_MSEX008526 [Manduca sexta]|uniref:Uncharacterized protein n=1 Tax=Manduca sexta TaxID=7130 RepID=A0A922CQJ0_MANSE|nr:hypothetical protein O3G_MSEX008526 [Manduca sexta]